MNRIRKAVSAALVAATLAASPVSSVAAADQSRRQRYEDRRDYDGRYDNRGNDGRYDNRGYERGYRSDWRNYDYRHFEPGQRQYDASRYYIRDDRYGERRLYRGDRVYRGTDNRYYCRRDDGTTGLIVGAMAGGVLGHILAPGGSKTLGAIIGAGAGGLLGREVDRGDIVCR